MRRPSMTAYKPTVRDMVARQALNLFGDTYANRNLARNFFGSSGLGATGEMSVADFTPAGVGFAADEAGRLAGQGHPLQAAANLGLAVVPIPAMAKGGKKVAGKGLRAVKKKAAPVFGTYRQTWRGGEPSWRDNEPLGQYRSDLFDITQDELRDDAGKLIGTRDKLVPKREIVHSVPAQQQDGKIFRGMSKEEYDNFQNTGEIKSNGSYNLGGQDGLTYWTTDPRSAESYANSFAPSQFKPSPDRPAFVVAARHPGPEHVRDVPGVGSHEVGLTRGISRDEITDVYRGDVVEYRPPTKNSSATAWLEWSRVQDIMKRYGVAAPVAAAILAGTVPRPAEAKDQPNLFRGRE